MTLIDSYLRTIDYLRVSVTDRCNFRCRYCMSSEGVSLLSHDEILRYEEIEKVIRVAASLGITKVRITGGEPLVRKDLVDFIGRISEFPGIKEIALTTNGTLLSTFARSLKRAGLSRINVSLDSLRPERFRQMTRQDNLREVLRGIEVAMAEGFKGIKTNTVLLRGFNEDEVLDFVEFGIRIGVSVRFIELMPTNSDVRWGQDQVIRSAEVIRGIQFRYQLDSIHVSGGEPVELFRVRGTDAMIGFISPISCKFCARCNRLRLTSEGKLLSCLHGQPEIDLRSLLRRDVSDEELADVIRAIVRAKPKEHQIGELQSSNASHRMSRIGG